jgi:dCMP deaminase
MTDCSETGCLRDQLGIKPGERHELCRGLHAEQNVIIQAAIHGISVEGADIYCTHKPCLICSKMLINCGIRNVYFSSGYPDKFAEDFLKEAGVNFHLLDAREEDLP